MDERLRFVARVLDGEKMASVCREFGISRKTGYKIFNRYKDEGLQGLEDRPRLPYRHPNRLPFQLEKATLRLKREHRTWGAPKIRDKLAKEYSGLNAPATSTIHGVLDRHGLVRRRKRRRPSLGVVHRQASSSASTWRRVSPSPQATPSSSSDPITTDADEARLENDLVVARLRHARLRALADSLANNTKAPRIEPYLDADVPAHRVAMQRQMFASQLAEHRARLAALERTVAKGKAAYCQRNRD